MQFTTVTAVREHYQLPDQVWRSFIEVCGDPNDDLKLLAVLPPRIVAASLERAQLPDGGYLSAIQASHVGLVYNLARRIVHTRGGGDWDSWKESSPFGDQVAPGPEGSNSQGPDAQATSKAERKLKMNNIIDQADDGEFTVQNEDTKAAWYQRYLEVVGGWPQGGRTHNGTIVRGAKEAANTGHSPICGLRHLRPLRLEGAESKQIQELHTDGKRLHHQRSAGSIGLHTVEGVLPNSTHDAHHVGCGDVGSPPQLRSSCGEAHPNLSHGVAPRIQCRRVGEVEPFEQTEITAPHGPEGWKDGPEKLGSCQTMGLGLSTTGPGRRLLADAGGGTSPHMAGSREPGHPKDPFGTTCDELHGRGPQGNHSSGGHEETTFEVHFKNVAKEEKKEQTNRRPRLPRAKRHRRRRRKERKEGQRKGRHKTKVLQLEQWYTTLWRFITWTNVCGKSSTLAPLHGLQFTRPPIEVLPKSNAGVNNHGEGHDGEGQKKEEAVAKAATPTTATPTRLKRRMTRRMKSEETKRTKTRRRTVMGARTKKNP